MPSDLGRLLGLALFTAVLVACFDPLYEDGTPSDAPIVFCCLDVVGELGSPSTCLRRGSTCVDQTSCLLPAYACVAGGRCTTRPCSAGTGGGGGGPNEDGGNPTGGGTGGGGGGSPDGGIFPDAGVADAEVADAGAPDAGTVTEFEFCCVASRVTTCACLQTGCLGAPFTLCLRGACVAGSTSASCP